jgi:glycosyltransferase involved in cell wall biosynthesis
MKICQITNVDFALRHFILPLMRGARSRGHEVIGICADGPMLEFVRAEGFRVIPVPMTRAASLSGQWRALRALLKVIKAERPDMVHGHMPMSGLIARLAARLAGVRVVAYTCHGFLFNQPGPVGRRVAAFVLEWCGARLTDRYLTVSTEEAADARRLHISERAIAVGNGRDPARFHPNPEARVRIRAELGTSEHVVVVCVVSRLVRHKGHPELLAAMREIPGTELWVVGNRLNSDRGEDLAPLFEASGLGTRLRRLGYRDDISDLLAAADIFALPSHFEGLPMSVIEAMLVGLPVVATDIRGPREQIVNGETGLLVPARTVMPLAAALRRLVDEPALRARMGEAGRMRALALYDEARVVARTLDALGL